MLPSIVCVYVMCVYIYTLLEAEMEEQLFLVRSSSGLVA